MARGENTFGYRDLAGDEKLTVQRSSRGERLVLEDKPFYRGSASHVRQTPRSTRPCQRIHVRKLHGLALKHISVATTEGYAARSGGSQRIFHAEVEAAEEEEHLELTVQAFRDARAGIMPAGSGARGLIDAFTHIDAEIKEMARTDPKILHDDRHLENLLRKLAKTLHVGPANFCWFRDPAKALCLRLAGTPDAKRPLSAARC